MNRDRLTWSRDDLEVNLSGPWAKEKYALLSNYIEMFSTGMIKKWGKRVYVDLYAGPGCTKLRDTGALLKGSPLIALSVKDPFDKYVFCEENSHYLTALRSRCVKGFSDRDISFVEGDCNAKVDVILDAIPPHSISQTVLTFCFVDPFSLNLQFKTIEKLSTKYMDFLVLLALDMDGRRNLKNYLKPSSNKIDLFLGSADWRTRWEKSSRIDNSFQRFLANEFEEKMLGLGYKKHLRGNTKHISTRDGTLPLYHLAFFSRHSRGYAFWDECLKYGSLQQQFEF
jgi:three-Cys-motif partner protein